MAGLELVHLTKRFGALTAVEDLNLSIADGEFVAVLGPSGCGKSTTLNMIVGLERPTEGEIRFDGAVVNRLPPQKRNIGMVFQDYAIFGHMSTYDNLAFGLKIRKLPSAEIRREVEEVARVLDLGHALDRPVSGLNLSELQRIAIGRTLVTKPAVLLFDEPLSNLEASLRARMRTELKTLQERLRRTAVYVTHDQVEAMALADRIAVMSRGRLQQYDTPAGVYDRPRNVFVAGFIGGPPMNLLPCRLRREEGRALLDFDGFNLDAGPFRELTKRATGDKLRLGVRPERVRLGGAGAAADWPRLPATVEALRAA